MRIAYVSETWAPSVDGVVTRLRATLGELHRAGHQTLMVAPAGAGLGRRAAPDPGVVEIPSLRLPFLGGGKPLGLPLTARVRAALDHFQPDLVHVINPFVLGMAGVGATRRAGWPLVASFHQDIAAVSRHYHAGFLSPAIWAHVRRLHQTAHLNLVTSRAMGTELAGHHIDRLQLWPYGVDLDRFHPRHRSDCGHRGLLGDRAALGDRCSGEVIALYVGRLAVEKDLHRLVPLARSPGVRLVVVGDGPLRRSLQAAMGSGNVHFTGWLSGSELADAYANADVFVFPSTTETLGLVLVEALASGLPVVAAESDPSAEILGDAGGGLLLAPGDWGDLPQVVRHVGAPGSAWRSRSEAARHRAQAWGWTAATETLVSMYRSVVETAAAQAA